MTEDQIRAMYDFDKSIHNSDRRKAVHTQRLDMYALDGDADEGQNPLLEKFADKLTEELDITIASRFAWVEDISDERLVVALKSLCEQDLELLTAVWIDGYTLEDMSSVMGIHKSSISRRLKRIKKNILTFF